MNQSWPASNPLLEVIVCKPCRHYLLALLHVARCILDGVGKAQTTDRIAII